jgi:transposase
VDSKATPGRKKRRPNYTLEFRKALAQRACEPGVSVSQLAQESDVNVNMLFKWRRYLLAGKFDVAAPQQAMLPVTIVEAPLPETAQTKAKRPALPDATSIPDTPAAQRGAIEIQIADATVRFDGNADLSTLRAVVRMLRS